MDYDKYDANLPYLHTLQRRKVVIEKRLSSPYFTTSETNVILDYIESEIAALKETQPELFI